MRRGPFGLALILLGACTPRSAAVERPAPLAPVARAAPEPRIGQVVEKGLLPAVVVKGAPPKPLAERMKHFAIPGVSVAVIRERKIAWVGTFGVKDATGVDPITPTTLFQAGSISKPVAAIAAMRMVQDGQLELDEDVTRRLVSWKLPADERTNVEKVTLRRLLSHSAGLGVHGFGGYVVGERVPTVAQVLDGAPPASSPAVRIEATPGSSMKYSGGGFTVMQALMIDVAKAPFAEIVRERVFARLGLSRSTYEQPLPAALHRDAATAHADGAPIDGRWRVHPELAAAGLWTTPTELARIMIEIENALDGRSELLSQATAREMLTAQKTGFGLGFAVEGEGPSARFSHGGANDGFEAYFVAYPARGEGVVVMTNGNGGGKLAKEVVRAVAREVGWPDYAPVERTMASLDASTLRAIEGAYEVAIDPKTTQRFEVESDGAGVVLRSAGDRPQRWLPASDTEFFTEDSETTFQVQKTGGAVTEIIIRQDGRVYRARKR